MTPSQWLSIARDLAILAALVFIVLWIRTDGKNAVKVQDMQAVQKQLAENAAKQSQYAQESRDAEFQRAQDLAKVTATIAANSRPILVQPATRAACPGSVPTLTTGTSGTHPSSGGADTGRGINLRPAVTAVELKYETALADCRAALAKWPK